MPPFALTAYRTAAAAFGPAAPLLLRARARRGKEERTRLQERLGWPGLPRPQGELVWVHGASVGECLSVLPLVRELLQKSGRSVLVTSGTVTSAALMSERLPAGAFHQFVPVDTPAAVSRFLDHWRPAAALFVDSELWPNLLSATHARGVRTALVNARMSARSFAGWRRVPASARRVLACFDICLAQEETSAERLRSLGAGNVRVSGNLKADVEPGPPDCARFAELAHAVGVRPVLLAASTHPGEDETLLPAHDTLRRNFPDLLTIIAPRHPARGADIAMLCGARPVVRRSQNVLPRSDTAVYVADTLGELSLLFAVAPFAFMGGSLVAHGGQNPLEAARMQRPVMAGPYTDNFAPSYAAVFAAQGAGRVHSCAEIVAVARHWLEDADAARRAGSAAAEAAHALGGALEKTRIAVEALLAHASA
ncbi:MAG TPA: 3-deoxy-D-manno-octulosonic acid transferase [Rhizomicrobium sp.]|jgi:3-deoxy-D-manno-octulosonic-acid transferase